MPSEDLHPLLKSLNQSVAKLREDVQKVAGEVTKVHTAIQEGVESIRDAIHENIQAQAELKLMEHVMDVRSVEPQIEAEYDQIQTEKEELDARLDSIADRYARKHEELDQKAADRVRDLGSHIFEIEESEFETGIEEPFATQVTTAWRTFQAHNDEVQTERTERVRATAGETVQTVHDFVDRQSELVSEIDAHRLDSLDTGGADRLQVPYYVVEYTVDGVTEREVVSPSTVSTSGDDEWSEAQLDSLAGMDSLLAGVDGVSSGSTERLDRDTVTETLEEYGSGPLAGDSYGEAVEKTLPEDVPVETADERGGGR
ncbi:hypothetical protein [Halorarius halobius]|uniref:hypothetical protein n=1 Tax=Halorarius halobius TaxID=2962671 RepID=UPI0020CD545D|nr:hypothetical protein [Halorarius halobius]